MATTEIPEIISSPARPPAVSSIGHPQEQFEIDDHGITSTTTLEDTPTSNDTSQNETEDEIIYPNGLPLYGTIAALIIVLITMGLDFSIVAVAVPSISNAFHTLADIGWYSTALRLVMCSFIFLSAKIYTIFPIKHVFGYSVLVFTIGNVISTFATTSNMFIVGRAVCGLGATGTNSGFWAIFTLSVPMRRRALYGSIGGGIETLASVVAPLIGGALIDKFGWRACFGVLVPLSVISLGIIYFFLPPLEAPGNRELQGLTFKGKVEKLDLLGTAMFVPGVVSLLLALQWAGTTYGWEDARIIALFVISVLFLVLFGWWQRKAGDEAMLPLRILGKRSIIAGAWFGACANGTLAVVEYYMSIYFQGARGYSAAKSGVLSLPMVIGFTVSMLIAGAGTTAIGYYYPFMFATTLLAPIAAGLLTTLDLESDLAKMLCYQALLGFGIGLGFQGPQLAAQTVLPPKEAMVGMAIITFGSQMGPVLFLAASATLFKNRLRVEISQFSPGTNASSIENMGLSDLQGSIGSDRLRDVLLGYDEAVMQTLHLPLALTCLTLLGAVAMDKVSVKKKQS